MKRVPRIGQRLACWVLAIAALILPSAALADTPAPKFTTPDENGVNPTSGLVWMQVEEGGIGSGPGRVSIQRIWAEGAKWVDNWTGGMFDITTGGVTKTYVQIAGVSHTFTKSGSTYTSDKADGATLVQLANLNFLYTGRDGTTIEFSSTGSHDEASFCPGSDASTCRHPVYITRPDGMKFTLGWRIVYQCVQRLGLDCLSFWTYRRLNSVSSSAGYSMSIAYWSDDPGTGYEPWSGWYRRTNITFNNSANPPSPAPTITYTYSSPVVCTYAADVTDPAGRTWRFTTDPCNEDRLIGIRRPGNAADNVTYAYGADGTVSSVVNDGVTTSYARSVSGSTATETITDALNVRTTITSDLNKQRPTTMLEAAGTAQQRSWGYQYDSAARLTRVTAPESNYTQFAYDTRGNVTTTTKVAKAGSGVPNIVTSSSFDATCTNIVKCNKPNSTTDARGNVTSYIYNLTHGGVVTVTPPSPGTGVQPQVRYSYTPVTSAAGDIVTMLTGVVQCPSGGTSCASASEVKTSAAYNSNLLPISISRGNSSGTVIATSSFTYDSHGNVATTDGPLPGSADTTKYRYDAGDRMMGVTSPDPDGAGTLKYRAVRITYRDDGQASKREIGTVTSQTDAAWANFSPLETIDIGYDSNSRVKTRKLSGAGVAYAMAQTSYDALGRVECQAVRLNKAAYGSLPGSACTPSAQGSDGPDRISQAVYDVLGQTTQIKNGVGTADVKTEKTSTYTVNGLVATVKDGENNLTTYEYDGQDRLSKTRFPVPGKGVNQSSTTDYEQLTYETTSSGTRTSGTVAGRRNRAGEMTGYGYDSLGRLILKNLPGTEPDSTYSYDNLNRMTSASAGGTNLTYAWDLLSRLTDQTGPRGALHSDYDNAGRRIQLTYPGTGLYVNYDYFVTGEVRNIRENGASSGAGVLAAYAYDDLGNRSSATFGNSVAETYTYDPVSRLQSLTNDPAGSASDLTIGSLAYNAASQITSAPRSNDSYSFGGLIDVNRAYGANGLNQYSTAGGLNFTYDTRGNLTSDGSSSFSYSSENLLKSATVSGVTTTFSYDPLLRLASVAGTSTTSFAYDMQNRIAEYDSSGTLLRRYVYGPRSDEPIVWYEGSGTADRRFLSSDERGSVISVTDSSGAPIATNTYDEHGIPGSGNSGKFQYTGQAWVPELGMYYYKARIYSPTLGRFLQADPTGYADQMNLYAYVGNDPINSIDPTGLQDEIVVTGQLLGGGTLWLVNTGGGAGGNGYAMNGGQVPVIGPGTPPAEGNAGNMDEIVVTARKNKRFGGFRLNLYSGKEEFFRVDAQGVVHRVPLKEEKVTCHVGFDTVEISKNRLPDDPFQAGDQYAVHTHGFGGSLSGLPGPGDAQIPLLFHIPLYGITQYGTWRISPSGNRVELRLLEGSWGPGGEDFDPTGYGSARSGSGGGSAGASSANKELCRAVSK